MKIATIKDKCIQIWSPITSCLHNIFFVLVTFNCANVILGRNTKHGWCLCFSVRSHVHLTIYVCVRSVQDLGFLSKNFLQNVQDTVTLSSYCSRWRGLSCKPQKRYSDFKKFQIVATLIPPCTLNWFFLKTISFSMLRSIGARRFIPEFLFHLFTSNLELI